MKHENYTKQEIADIRDKEHDQWSSDKFDSVLDEILGGHKEMTPTEYYQYVIKNMVSFKLDKDCFTVYYPNNDRSILWYGTPNNSFTAQMLANLHKDKELK